MMENAKGCDLVLTAVANLFNRNGITWGLGGSLMLMQHGIAKHANDIDLLVALSDSEKAHAVLKTIAPGERGTTKPPYHTAFFYKHNLDGLSIDLMGGYRIEHVKGIYEHPFDAASIRDYATIGGETIPLSPLEDWYVSYQLICRTDKVEMLEAHFRQHGVKYPDLFIRALEQPLPEEVRHRLQRLLF